jgi:hypothetical protein
VLKFSEMGVNIVMDVIGGVPLIQQFVKNNGKPEQHKRSGVFGFFYLNPITGVQVPLGTPERSRVTAFAVTLFLCLAVLNSGMSTFPAACRLSDN